MIYFVPEILLIVVFNSHFPNINFGNLITNVVFFRKKAMPMDCCIQELCSMDYMINLVFVVVGKSVLSPVARNINL